MIPTEGTRSNRRWPGAAGVHDRDHHINGGQQRAMGVTVDDDFRVREMLVQRLRGGRAELVAVDQHEVEALDPFLDHCRQPMPEVPTVRIAVHGGNRGEGFEFGEQLRRADVSSMEDVVHLREYVEDLGAEQAVGVGDDAEAHGGSIRYPLSDSDRGGRMRRSLTLATAWQSRSPGPGDPPPAGPRSPPAARSRWDGGRTPGPRAGPRRRPRSRW